MALHALLFHAGDDTQKHDHDDKGDHDPAGDSGRSRPEEQCHDRCDPDEHSAEQYDGSPQCRSFFDDLCREACHVFRMVLRGRPDVRAARTARVLHEGVCPRSLEHPAVKASHAGHDRIGMTRTRYLSSRRHASAPDQPTRPWAPGPRRTRSRRRSAQAPPVIACRAPKPLLRTVRVHIRFRLDLGTVAARTNGLDVFGIRRAAWIRRGHALAGKTIVQSIHSDQGRQVFLCSEQREPEAGRAFCAGQASRRPPVSRITARFDTRTKFGIRCRVSALCGAVR
jgi:hypothetical protein